MQSQVAERNETQEEQAPVCRHHWVIESPHGATSMGICKICAEVREFRNSATDALWEGDPMVSASRMAAGQRPILREVRLASRDE